MNFTFKICEERGILILKVHKGITFCKSILCFSTNSNESLLMKICHQIDESNLGTIEDQRTLGCVNELDGWMVSLAWHQPVDWHRLRRQISLKIKRLSILLNLTLVP